MLSLRARLATLIFILAAGTVFMAPQGSQASISCQPTGECCIEWERCSPERWCCYFEPGEPSPEFCGCEIPD